MGLGLGAGGCRTRFVVTLSCSVLFSLGSHLKLYLVKGVAVANYEVIKRVLHSGFPLTVESKFAIALVLYCCAA